MVVYTNLIECRVCGKIFPHSLPLLAHFDEVHSKEAYTLAIQQNSKPVDEYISLYVIIFWCNNLIFTIYFLTNF